MPKSDEQLERVREESRARIVAAALGLFARQGYDRTTIRQIAREAGISQGLMYNYYGGKEELLREIFARSMRAVRESAGRAPSGGAPAERLERLIRGSLSLVTQQLDFWRLSYGLRMQPGALRGGADEIRGWSESLRREIQEVLEAAGVTGAAVEAAVLFALIDGVAQHYALAPRRYPLDEVTEAIVARYRGVAGGASR